MHPELKIPPRRYRNFVTTFQQQHPGTWREAQPPNRDVADGWNARIRLIDDQTALQQEMDSLAEQFSSAEQASVLEEYAFTPAHPKPIAYLTANFLHGGWLHLIGNRFLWLAGAILEDTWGRLIYPIVYFLAGAAALQFHAWLNPGSLAPLSAPPAP
jgi:membrane associated rhomboid family serine protease